MQPTLVHYVTSCQLLLTATALQATLSYNLYSCTAAAVQWHQLMAAVNWHQTNGATATLTHYVSTLHWWSLLPMTSLKVTEWTTLAFLLFMAGLSWHRHCRQMSTAYNKAAYKRWLQNIFNTLANQSVKSNVWSILSNKTTTNTVTFLVTNKQFSIA